MIATTASLGLGLIVGARHALEPDHLAAVSTLVTTTNDRRSAAWLGALWGLGHTLALVGVGGALLVLDDALPARVSAAFELVVAAMLIVLGARAVIRGVRNREGDAGLHRHGAVVHAHAGAGQHLHVGARAIAWRPLAVGLVHGLAGSGALTALAFAELPSSGARVAFMIVFGAGSIAGMAIVTAVAGMALSHVARGAATRRWLAITTGLVSCVIGVVWAL